ncbi:murein L,D-transpeptidase catalytic domain family protein [Sphingomonas sp. PR090111-T3T-6A]|uniref:murein L,D-transpeptidase catalytic domain family protein n=1 Tax=Sphingomonas sp. PR090111-T3T-6A TaxID=685778 RepID=UPI000373209E|nr:murein L,D-transpeptidase catalytic domain family protein [Sphingomonas sp. PR090111-T3T-6A]
MTAGLIAGPAMAQINSGLPGLARPTATAMPASPMTIRPDLFRRALQALQKHGDRIQKRDRIALVDFDLPSSQPRFHIVDLDSGRSRSLLVAHGRGSDPEHTGWLTRFSNVVGSAASSDGAYLTGDIYVGQHGRSRRLYGLDRTNSNVQERAIVVHSAWYVGSDMIAQHGKLGRSEGCFALSAADLEDTLSTLGQGRMIYADKV